MRRILSLILLLSGPVSAEGLVQYLANEGVMVVHGEMKILFDPLFRNDYDQYQLLPLETERALMAGRPPFDGIDAVFISHYHGDHFSPADVLSLLRIQDALHLYAPQQAVDDLYEFADSDDPVYARVTAIGLSYRDVPARFETSGMLIEAVRIPHSGWPQSQTDVQNIAFRITLNDEVTILHLGDADTGDEHFARDADFWSQRKVLLALPPYWYFTSAKGRAVLTNRLQPGHSVGIHVPRGVAGDPAARPPELQDFDLFTQPGETRILE